ncbi:MAG: bifunctional 3-deoxy-7-phosphoheptulonate synthase/chorismate mutase type II [Lentimicrobiaceae bacterium]|nr:bifunctional 3-deoxy-7-phosphoheptulonate synthase/chorismate mutase type II [Lentimicrobiaceae bacterium]MCO5265216.1 bifunctional 3-deoxy-7-phosphoheptulonate synthase/chorismate mutase type II [Lentimicrobium sp.]HPG32279.1 chorismate mutase [Lentimicrobium sp.]
MDFQPLHVWIPGSTQPLVIAGPCSAETEEQVMITAQAISQIPQVKVFRAGIWKPRTRPGTFEGVGVDGLRWLKRVKKETGLLTTVEVASPQHVQEALAHNIDILWIGARTVVNPFSMQELSESLAGIDIPVMVKNPVNPDLGLWIGAIERLYKNGLHRIAAIHRGFYQFEKTQYRNAPQWEIPIELMRQMPGLPVICDPSHIGGNRKLLQQISQQALDLEMQGLMIETHPNPDLAWTDAAQQVTPATLDQILNQLILRDQTGSREFERSLEELRLEIDQIDYEMIQLLAKRMHIAEEMGLYKYTHNITILQLQRWKKLFADRIKKGRKAGLDTKFLAALLQLVHEQSIQIQTEVMNQPSSKKH